MQFMSLYRPASDLECATGPSPAERTRMEAFMEQEMRAGTLVSTGGMMPSSRGCLVRRSGASITVVDGPFTEAKELVLGFAILKVASKDEAIASATRFLGLAGDGTCEVRPMHGPEFGAPPSRWMSLFRAAGPEPSAPAAPSDEERAAMQALAETETRAGILLATGGLGPSAFGARVRRAGADVSVVDGPFGGTTGLVEGYAILEVASKVDAIATVKRFLALVGDGECEVRPFFGPENPGCAAA